MSYGIFFFNLFLAVFGLLCFLSGLSLVEAAATGDSLLLCTGFSMPWLLLLQSTGFRHPGSVVVVNRLSCSEACGIFLD